MLCTDCGASPANRATDSGRVRLRATGRPDEPFVMVCERCGRDIVSPGAGTPAGGASGHLAQFGLGPQAPPLFGRRPGSR